MGLDEQLIVNRSSFTVLNHTCLVLTSGWWLSERPYCRPQGDGTFMMVVEHFNDSACKERHLPDAEHTTDGCYYFAGQTYNYNSHSVEPIDQSYNDKCNSDGTLTVSAFQGKGCLNAMS